MRALRALRERLVDDGVLLIAERHPDRASDFTQGVQAAWWHGEESAQQGSLLLARDWAHLLREQGWLDLRTIADPAIDELGLGSFLLIARPTPQSVETPATAPHRWAVIADDPGWERLAEALTTRLLADGGTVARSAAADGCDDWVLFAAAPNVAEGAARIAQHANTLREHLLDAARRAPQARLWVITRGGALQEDECLNAPTIGGAAIWGLVRVAANELHPLRLSLIDLEDANPAMAPRLAQALSSLDGETEIVLGARTRHAVRVLPLDTGRDRAADQLPGWRLDFSAPGQLRNLHWRACAHREVGVDEIEIETRAAGLNFRDLMYAMGLLADEALENGFAGATLGLEVAGRVSRCGRDVSEFKPGDDVLAFAGASFADRVIVPARAAAKMPPHWTYAEAATVPTAFFTVWYSLVQLARLQPGERLLVHGAAGGVGIAAIQIARHLGAQVFASAGSEAKREFVALLGADHVLDSRSPHFDEAVLELTAGEGVDVVLNSLAGEAIQRNLRAIKPFGRFVELGKRDFYENTAIGLRPFRNNVSYFGVDADQLMAMRPELASAIFRDIMALFADERLYPLPHRVFAADEVVEAFRHMQQAKQIGKVVVDLSAAPCDIQRPNEAQPLRLDPKATYLVSGGLSGFGLATAGWLCDRGARHLALVSRRGAQTPGVDLQIAALRARGVDARAFACDVADPDAVAKLLEELAASMPVLRGVVHAAMVLDDALLGGLDAQRFERVLAPKVDGAWNLHTLTRKLPLDLFVLFSSATTLLGNVGQANYVAANAALEALARIRRREGRPACAIAWGPIADVGVLTRDATARDALQARLGVTAVDARTMLDQLDEILRAPHGAPAVVNFDWRTLQRMLPAAQDHRFDELRRHLGSGQGAEDDGDLRARLRGLGYPEARQLVIEVLAAEIGEILRLPAERIVPGQSVYELGMDSLMAVELTMVLEKRFGVNVPPMLIHQNPSLERIAERLLENLLGDADGRTDATQQLVESMAVQHGEQDALPTAAVLVDQVRESARTGTRLIE